MFGRIAGVKYEDGLMRSPIAAMFNDLKLKSLADSLQPLISENKNFVKLIKVSYKKAHEDHLSKFKQLSLEMKAAIAFYTAAGIPTETSPYFIMNAALREKDRSKMKPWRWFIWLLLNALHALPRERVRTVWRGAKIPLSVFGSQYKKGKSILWAGFSSASKSLEEMNTFVGKVGPRTLFSIELGPGLGWNIQAFSFFPKEAEVLLPPNVEFKVCSVLNAGSGFTLVHLKQIESDDFIIQPSVISHDDEHKLEEPKFKVFKVGELVLAKSKGFHGYYPGAISKINDASSVAVKYEGGDFWSHCPLEYLQPYPYKKEAKLHVGMKVLTKHPVRDMDIWTPGMIEKVKLNLKSDKVFDVKPDGARNGFIDSPRSNIQPYCDPKYFAI